MRLLRIVPDHTTFDFMRFRRISFPVSALLGMISLVALLTFGLNLGIDFQGGTLMELQGRDATLNISEIRGTMEHLGFRDVQVQEFGDRGFLVRIAEQPGGESAQQAVVQRIKAVLADRVEYRRTEVVGPLVSRELLSNGILGLVIATCAILIYLWFRFEWQFALGAIIANLHDILLTLGFMCVTRLDFDLSSIAALLTILGYSLNDTVVIYDRIRETRRKYKAIPIDELLNTSINSTLSRSIITHLTVAMSLIALLTFGGNALFSFTAMITFGCVLVGTYTSVFIASPILIYLGVKTQAGAEAPEPAPVPAAKSAAAPAAKPASARPATAKKR